MRIFSSIKSQLKRIFSSLKSQLKRIFSSLKSQLKRIFSSLKSQLKRIFSIQSQVTAEAYFLQSQVTAEVYFLQSQVTAEAYFLQSQVTAEARLIFVQNSLISQFLRSNSLWNLIKLSVAARSYSSYLELFVPQFLSRRFMYCDVRIILQHSIKLNKSDKIIYKLCIRHIFMKEQMREINREIY